jgi:hypothetical protein
MPKNSPLQQVNTLHGSKDKLVARVAELLPSSFAGESAEDYKKRLKYVANSKLLRLVKLGEEFVSLGGVEKIVDTIAVLKGQSKDKDFKASLSKLSVPRLLDLHRSLARKTKAAAKKAAADTAKKKSEKARA